MSSLFFDASEPRVTGPTITDNVTGMYACYGILGALWERERSGKGLRVDGYAARSERLGEIFLTRPRAEWVGRLEACEVPYAPVNTIPEVMEDPQVRHLGVFEKIMGQGEEDIVLLTRPSRSMRSERE